MTFKEKEGLLKALSMANGQLGGRTIRVEVARPQRGGGNRRGKHYNLMKYLSCVLNINVNMKRSFTLNMT